jgi:hypothetical protein
VSALLKELSYSESSYAIYSVSFLILYLVFLLFLSDDDVIIIIIIIMFGL